VPVIAVCGKAGPEIARELIECGADDFLDKKDLTRQKIENSVREVLTRWDACRRPEFHTRLNAAVKN
jgi:FixJ family two-component response regulator